MTLKSALIISTFVVIIVAACVGLARAAEPPCAAAVQSRCL